MTINFGTRKDARNFANGSPNKKVVDRKEIMKEGEKRWGVAFGVKQMQQ